MMPKTPTTLEIIEATSAQQIELIRQLFVEYSQGTGLDLCFQNFKEELAGLPGRYAPPGGHLLLAVIGGEPAGCVALRALEGGLCEMKRLYVRPAFRRSGTGRLLAETVIAAARNLGYTAMRLDTLRSMEAAIGLYRSLGFRQIPAYYDNPNDCVFMELQLGKGLERRGEDSIEH